MASPIEDESKSNASTKPSSKTLKVPIDPLSITESLGIQTFRRESRRPWSKEEDTQLRDVIMKAHDTANVLSTISADDINWEMVAQSFAQTTQRKVKDCRKRWCNSLDPNLRKGKWTEEEDSKLLLAYNKWGASWKKVAAEIGGRTDDQCAKRYIEVLDPTTKDRLKPWSHDEDLQLIRSVKVHGTKWKAIAQEIHGRPSLTCRNRWRKIMTDVVRKKAIPAIQKEVELMNTECVSIKSENESQSISQGHSPNNNSSQPLSITQESKTLQLQTTNQQRQLDAPKLRKTVQSEVEWKYSLSNENNRREIFQEGPIANEQLVQYLISHAKNNGMEITVHQHIHHHYPPPSTTHQSYGSSSFHQQQHQHAQNMQPLQPQQNNQLHQSHPHNQQHQQDHHFQHHHQSQYQPSPQNQPQQQYPTITSPFIASGMSEVPTPTYYVEPETQVNRYQHFNYLPPLTEVPKLNSSASSPTSSSKEGQNQHHYHHHYQQPKPQPSIPATKESDLLRLLNGRSPIHRAPSPLSNSTQIPTQLQQNLALLQARRTHSPLTPLAQAVELAAEEEEGNTKKSIINNNTSNNSDNNSSKNSNVNGNVFNNSKRRNSASQRQDDQPQSRKSSVHNNTSPKRPKFEDEDEEGLDFWETMRNLTKPDQKQVTPSLDQGPSANATNTTTTTTTTSTTATNNINGNNQNHNQINKPVSQHHPLHHRSGNTPLPFDYDAEVEEALDAYGLFFNVYKDATVPVGNNTNGNTNNNNGNTNTSNNDQSAYDAIASTFGMIPFNPS